MILSFIKKAEKLPINKLHLAIVLLGMLIATQIQYIQHGWINPDSVLYFESARLFALGEWKQAADIFSWPLYALIIAAVHKLTSLSIHTSAQVLNVIFFGMATASFIKIIQLAGGKSRAMLAGALILFSAQYIVGNVLEMLLRDGGFWAFFLTSLVFFIRYYKTGCINDAIIWQLCAIIAMLFRVEGITYLIGLPLILLITQAKNTTSRFRSYLIANSLSILATISLFTTITLSNTLTIKSFGRLREIFDLNLFQALTRQFYEKAEIMSQQVLGSYLDEFAVQGLLLTFAYVIIAKILSTTGIINVGLAFFSIKSKAQLIDKDVWLILKITMIIAIINMALIVTKVFVLSGRYAAPLALVLMILASLFLANLAKHLDPANKNDRKVRWFFIALLVIMLLGVIKNILPKRQGHNYMQDAASWLKQNNPSGKPVFLDDTRMTYHTNSTFNGKWDDNWQLVLSAIDNGSIQKNEFLLLTHSKKHIERLELVRKRLPNFTEIERFNNAKKRKYIVVYRKSQLLKID